MGREGSLIDFLPLYSMDGTKVIPKYIIVYKHFEERSGALIKPNILWDNSGYALGVSGKKKLKMESTKFEAFKEEHKKLFEGSSDPALKAVLKFLEKWNPEKTYELAKEHWEILADNFMVFRIEGEQGYVHDIPEARRIWEKYYLSCASNVRGQCLVTGQETQIARLHPAIKGVKKAQTKGASIVSFNKDSFTSYGKDQSFNAPVGERAAFNYTTALNSLLRDNARRIQVGDATVLFWAEKDCPAERFVPLFIAPPKVPDEAQAGRSEDDAATAQWVRDVLRAVRDGRKPSEADPGLDESIRFYVLGLSPNSSRLSVRFWEVNTLGSLLKRVGRHYNDMYIARGKNDPEFPPLWMLLRQMAAQGEDENIPKTLAGSLMRSILTGASYPGSLLAVLVGRIRAEQSLKDKNGRPVPNVNYLRAALLKACLVRNCKKEVPVSLDAEKTDRPYLLGRLFAILEKAQEEAIPGTNATIRDKFFASASATPGRVFPLLLNGVQNHIAKLRKSPDTKGRATGFDIMIANITDGLDAFPATQKLEDQGLFALGYYHQRKDLFTKFSEKHTEE
ncbi:MAG: type I-C CRISPR-associated protein Cas8c/Csd1 [Thermodesulfobacteriota bacterium]|nr:type I-C CRISPR-associated protein Cas8c/Csd1 [Thermodesulfobacteriota bacterium]